MFEKSLEEYLIRRTKGPPLDRGILMYLSRILMSVIPIRIQGLLFRRLSAELWRLP